MNKHPVASGLPWLLLLLASLGFLGALDQNVIVTALPRMLGDANQPFLQFNLRQAPSIALDSAGWVITGYLLGYVVVLPLMGAVSDAFGRRRVLLASLAVFALGSVCVALAQSLVGLVLARTLQAIGGGALLPAALAAAGDLAPRGHRGLALGCIVAAAELGGLSGPIYGAFIAQQPTLGWRLIFWLNVPIVVVLAMLICLLPGWGARSRLPPAPVDERRRVDYGGGLALGAALAALVAGTSSSGIFASGAGGGSGNRWYLLLCAGLLILLWRIERQTATPLLSGAIVRQPRFVAACLVNALVGIVLSVTMVAMPVYATTILDISSLQGGLLLLRYLLPLSLGAALGGWLGDRWGAQTVGACGLCLAAVGHWLLVGWLVSPPHSPSWAPPALAGLGVGLVAAPVTVAALSAAGEAWSGALASLITAARVCGMMAGLSVATSWASWRFHSLAAGVPAPSLAGLGSRGLAGALLDYSRALQAKEILVLQGLFAASALICVLAMLPALRLGGVARA